MDSVEEIISNKQPKPRYKRLNVTHGFHSQFTDPLLPGLTELAATLKFSKATIPLETCSANAAWNEITPTQITEHTRTAVYFQEAIERIASRLGSCTWLEAGSNSSVTGMVRRALGSSASVGHSYQAINLSGGDDVLGALSDATANLWKLGHKVQFWPFHPSQSNQYSPINLPPYQFEKTRHWLAWQDIVETSPVTVAVERDTGVEKFELLKLASRDQKRAEFIVDPRSEELKVFVQGHAVLDQPLCPADLYVELASIAALQIVPNQAASFIPSVETLSIIAPLGIDGSRTITLSLIQQGSEKELCWDFKFASQARVNPQKIISHTSGKVILTLTNGQKLELEFQRYERLIGSGRAMSLLAEPDSEGMQGKLVYKSFARVVNHAKYYQGVKKISSKGDDVAALITMPVQDNKAFANALMDPVAVDNFVQVAGIKVNCLNTCPVDQVYICGYIEKIQASKEFMQRDLESRSWTVVANCTPMGEKDYLNDVYVFNESKKLVMLILGVRFTRVAIVSLAKAISAASAAKSDTPLPPTNNTTTMVKRSIPEFKPLHEPKRTSQTAIAPSDTSSDMFSATLRNLLNKVADVPLDLITPSAKFEDLGIDSLMSTEVLAEINQAFNVDISSHQFQDLQDISSLSGHLLQISGVSTESSFTVVSSPGTMIPSPMDSSASTSIAEEPQATKGSSVANLAKLVAEPLEISVTMTADICLGDYGLDSLMGVQLANDIEEAFGVSLDSSAISAETTFGQLAHKVFPSTIGPGSGIQKQEPSAMPLSFKDVPSNAKRMPGDRMKTILFKQAGPTALFADVYLPDADSVRASKRPIALMIHGGGHTMLSRKDIRPRQTELLLANGFLPVSIDYRLCPEISIIDGPTTDVCDALKWVRTKLPALDLGLLGLMIDGDKVAVVGWSTGGTLSLTLGFTAVQKGVKPPDATLVFYCPSNYEADCWKKPNYPENTQEKCPDDYDLLEGVLDAPITAYNANNAVGGWMSLSDPRSRIVLHMNWKGQALPVLLNGLPSKRSAGSPSSKSYISLPQPSQEKIISISLYSQIVRGNYRVLTYLIHGTRDDLIPWQQMQRTHDALREKGVPTGLGILEGAVHLFDLYSGRKEKEWAVVTEGYKFLINQLQR